MYLILVKNGIVTFTSRISLKSVIFFCWKILARNVSSCLSRELQLRMLSLFSPGEFQLRMFFVSFFLLFFFLEKTFFPQLLIGTLLHTHNFTSCAVSITAVHQDCDADDLFIGGWTDAHHWQSTWLYKDGFTTVYSACSDTELPTIHWARKWQQ